MNIRALTKQKSSQVLHCSTCLVSRSAHFSEPLTLSERFEWKLSIRKRVDKGYRVSYRKSLSIVLSLERWGTWWGIWWGTRWGSTGIDGWTEKAEELKFQDFGIWFLGGKTLHLMASVRSWQKCEKPIWKLLNKLMLQLKLLLWYLIGGIFENVLKICIPNIWNSTISLNIWFVEPGN